VAKRTYMPLLKGIAQLVISKVGQYEKQIRANLGEGVWFLTQLLVGIASVLVSTMDGNSDAEGDYLSPLTIASAAQINAVKSAVAAYKAANDVGEAW